MLGSKGHSPQAWVVMRSTQEWVIDNLKSGVRISNAALLRGWQALKLLSHHLLPPFPHMSRKPESDAEPRLKARHTNILCRQPRQLLLTAVPTVCLDVKVFNSQINFPFHSTFFVAFFPPRDIQTERERFPSSVLGQAKAKSSIQISHTEARTHLLNPITRFLPGSV